MCEGGSIEYWANPHEIRGEDYREYNGRYIIAVRIKADIEPLPGHTVEQTIDGSTIRAGIQRILLGEVPVNSKALGCIAAAIAQDDVCLIDGEDVDLIVQAGLYNDIAYG
jgi:hypothetical protein